MRKMIWIGVLGLLLIGAGCVKTTPANTESSTTPSVTSTNETAATDEEATPTKREYPGILPDDQILNKIVKIETEKGEIVMELYGDTAPRAVSNFVSLIVSGYYNGLTFHRREEGFVIQGGDPNGNGTGGPGYDFEDELTDSYSYTRGMVAMANRGPDTNGSQFFIMLADYPLPKKYTIFGKVLSGMEVVDQIAVGDKMTTVTVESK
ncbi:MAG: peptidylprolyl isomerase [Patescibacteria group bacterium]